MKIMITIIFYLGDGKNKKKLPDVGPSPAIGAGALVGTSTGIP